MSQKPLSVLIAGGGIAGSSLALMLSRHASFNPKPIVTLVERFPEPRTTGQAIHIRGPAVPVIQKLGLEGKIKARHTTETGIAFVNAKGEKVARFDMNSDANKKNQSATSEFEILRGELAGLLLEEVDAVSDGQQGIVKIVYGESIKTLQEHSDGVAVEFTNGKLEAQKFDVVIAADGMSSRTRLMIFPEYEAMDVIKPLGMYIAYFTIPRIDSDEDFWLWYTVPEGLAVHIRPHRNKTTMGVYLSITNAKRERSPEIDDLLSQNVGAQKKMLRERFKDVGWQIERIFGAMDQADDFYMQQVAMVRAPKWTKGRCAILGDAAYCVMGMGTSLAIIGAYLVAGELANISSHESGDVAAALERYQQILQPLANQDVPSGFPQLANPQTKMGVGIWRTSLRFAYWTGIAKLLQGLVEPSEGTWKLPEYGYESPPAEGGINRTQQ